MQDNLAVIDYSRAHNTRVPIERCPTGAIVWVEEDGQVIKGDEARPTPRHSSRPYAPT
jgi:hypothetical protein